MNYINLIFGTFLIALLMLAFVGAMWSMWKMPKMAEKTHDKLNDLIKRSKSAKTKDELIILWEELKIVVKKECWHNSFSSKVITIKAIIQTKYEMLSSHN